MIDNGFYNDIISIAFDFTNYEIESMEFELEGRRYPIATHNSEKLKLWKSFVHHRRQEGRPLQSFCDYLSITPEEFCAWEQSILTITSHDNPTSASSATVTKCEHSTFHVHMTDPHPRWLPVMTEDWQFNEWLAQTTLYARQQGCKDVIDPEYEPQTTAEIDAFQQQQQEFMYSFFIRTLQTDYGQHVLRTYESTRDAHSIFVNFVAHYTTMANLESTETYERLQTTRLIVDSWCDTYHAFIVHYEELFCEYNEMQSDVAKHIPAKTKQKLLANAV
jgi:hypothetical protein